MSTDTLDFPEIDAPAASASTAIATAAAGAIDLKRIDLTDVALAQYGNWREDVGATKANLSTLVLDLSTGAKVKEARALRQRLIGDPLAAVRKVSAGIKSKMAQASKAVGAELERIEAAYTEADALILPLIEAREKELAAEKAQRDAEEAARKEKHRSGIENIRCYLDRCHAPGMTSARIANGMAALQALTFGPEWEEFAVPAANAQCETLESMRLLHAAALGREQEAARQELLRQENERVAAELAAERARIAQEAADLRRQAQELQREKDDAAAAELLRQAAALNRQKLEAAQASAAAPVAAAIADAPDSAAGMAENPGQEPEAASEFISAPTPTGEGKAVTPGAGNAEAAPIVLEPKPAESSKSHPTHGFSQTVEYRAWQTAMKRCTDPENAAWENYGGRGISMCERWLSSVAAFIEDMGAKPSDLHELDREDNDRGYEPGNCRWVLRSENNRNRRSNRIVEWQGQQKTLVEWCEITGLAFSTLKWRLDDGWSVDRAMTESATADATDRGTAADASPRGGAMGAGQAAAAAPAGEQNSDPSFDRAADPDQFFPVAQLGAYTVDWAVLQSPLVLLALLAESQQVNALVMTAFSGRFPSHPKPDATYWNTVRAQIEDLQPRIEAALGGK